MQPIANKYYLFIYLLKKNFFSFLASKDKHWRGMMKGGEAGIKEGVQGGTVV
jgi:hypothetical protein